MNIPQAAICSKPMATITHQHGIRIPEEMKIALQ
jgi:hypothetical protein